MADQEGPSNYDDHGQAEGEQAARIAALVVRFATELGRRERFRDHACVQCVGPEAELVIEGFVCIYHEAAALLTDPRYLKIKEGKG